MKIDIEASGLVSHLLDYSIIWWCSIGAGEVATVQTRDETF